MSFPIVLLSLLPFILSETCLSTTSEEDMMIMSDTFEDQGLVLLQKRASIVSGSSFPVKRASLKMLEGENASNSTDMLLTSDLPENVSQAHNLSSTPSMHSAHPAEPNTALHLLSNWDGVQDSSLNVLNSHSKMVSVLALSMLLMLAVMGPDHLGTLAPLCAATKGWDAFKNGIIWGFGNAIGVGFVIIMAPFPPSLWIFIGNCFTGALMICVGLYFIHYQSSYLIQQDDSSPCVEQLQKGKASASKADEINPFECIPCQLPGFDFQKTFGRPPLMKASSRGSVNVALNSGYSRKGNAEQVLSSAQDQGHLSFWAQVLGPCASESIVIGLLQGLTCPSGLQAVVILADFSQNFSPLETFLFLLGFYLFAIMFSGVVTFCVSKCLARGFCELVSPKALYNGCCAFTITLGITWTALNAFGNLKNIF